VGSYNASVVKIYNITGTLVRLEKNHSTLKTALAYYNAGIVPSCKFRSRRIGSGAMYFTMLLSVTVK
jgi:hypothetical protein